MPARLPHSRRFNNRHHPTTDEEAKKIPLDIVILLIQSRRGRTHSLKLIGKGAFCRSGVVEIHIPDGVEELCEKCFYECESLSCVTFGESSSLKLIGETLL